MLPKTAQNKNKNKWSFSYNFAKIIVNAKHYSQFFYDLLIPFNLILIKISPIWYLLKIILGMKTLNKRKILFLDHTWTLN